MALTAVTRDVTRTNPAATALNTIIETNQLSVYNVLLSNTGVVTDLDAAGVQQVLENIGAPVHIAQADANGRTIALVIDGHSTDIDSVAQEIGSMFDDGSVASGVFTADGGGTVTVTIPTDIFGMAAS
jgi:hypothetical protein